MSFQGFGSRCRCSCHLESPSRWPDFLVPSCCRLGLGLLVPAQDRPAGWKTTKKKDNPCVFSMYVCINMYIIYIYMYMYYTSFFPEFLEIVKSLTWSEVSNIRHVFSGFAACQLVCNNESPTISRNTNNRKWWWRVRNLNCQIWNFGLWLAQKTASLCGQQALRHKFWFD